MTVGGNSRAWCRTQRTVKKHHTFSGALMSSSKQVCRAKLLCTFRIASLFPKHKPRFCECNQITYVIQLNITFKFSDTRYSLILNMSFILLAFALACKKYRTCVDTIPKRAQSFIQRRWIHLRKLLDCEFFQQNLLCYESKKSNVEGAINPSTNFVK